MFLKAKIIFLLSTFEFLFLMFGIFLPLAKVQELWIFNSSYSIFQIFIKLIYEGEFIMGLIILFFGILFPILKIISRIKSSNFIEKYNLIKLSMLDIFILAFIIFSSKTSIYYKIEFLSGFYFLLISILIGYLSFFLKKINIKF